MKIFLLQCPFVISRLNFNMHGSYECGLWYGTVLFFSNSFNITLEFTLFLSYKNSCLEDFLQIKCELDTRMKWLYLSETQFFYFRFVLYQLSKNLNRPFFVDFLTHLSIRYTDQGGKLDDEDPEETENHSQLLRPSYTPKSNDYGIDRVSSNCRKSKII